MLISSDGYLGMMKAVEHRFFQETYNPIARDYALTITQHCPVIKITIAGSTQTVFNQQPNQPIQPPFSSSRASNNPKSSDHCTK